MTALRNLDVLRQPRGAVEHVVPEISASAGFVGEIQLAVINGQRRALAGLCMTALGDLEILRQP